MAKPVRYQRGFWGGFFGTVLWAVPMLLVSGLGGYCLARFVLAPHFLQPGAVRYAHPQAIRVLSPEEAAAVARDEPSPVWTRGVQDSDIPKMETGTEEQPKHHSWHAKPKDEKAKTAAPADNSEQPDTPIVDSPAKDNGSDTPPKDTGDAKSSPDDTLPQPDASPDAGGGDANPQ